MTFTITFSEPKTVPNHGGDFRRFCYFFTIVDSAFVGTPEQTAQTKHRSLWVTASPENSPWKGSQLSERNLIKALYHYGREYVLEHVQADTLPEDNPIEMPMIHTGTTPQCPLSDLDNIPWPAGDTFDVERDRRITGFNRAK